MEMMFSGEYSRTSGMQRFSIFFIVISSTKPILCKSLTVFVMDVATDFLNTPGYDAAETLQLLMSLS